MIEDTNSGQEPHAMKKEKKSAEKSAESAEKSANSKNIQRFGLSERNQQIQLIIQMLLCCSQ